MRPVVFSVFCVLAGPMTPLLDKRFREAFEGKRKPKYPVKNLSEQRENDNKLNQYMALMPGLEPGPH